MTFIVGAIKTKKAIMPSVPLVPLVGKPPSEAPDRTKQDVFFVETNSTVH